MIAHIFLPLFAIILAPFVKTETEHLIVAEPHIRSCLRTNPLPLDQLERLKYSIFTDGPTPAIQCFVRCFMERSHFYDPVDGKLNPGRAIAGLTYEHQMQWAVQTMDVCKSVSGLGECDTAYQVYKCYKQALMAH